MLRALLLMLMALALSSCVLLVEDDDWPRVRPVTPVVTVEPGIVTPGPGTFTYRCIGGTLVVNYVDSHSLRLFYDGAWQGLGVVRRSPTLLFSGGVYTWEWTGSRGTLWVRGRVVLSHCTL